MRYVLTFFLFIAWTLAAALADDQAPAERIKKTPSQHGTVPLPEGGQLAYHIRPGIGPTVVLIPGSFGDYLVLDAVVAKLNEAYNVVVVELRGHGGSWPPTLNGSMESFAEDVLRVTDALKLRRFYVGGHSIGGMIAIELAGRRPEAIVGAVSIEGWTHYKVQREAFAGVVVNTLDPEQEAERQANRARVLDRLSDEQRTAFATVWRRWDGYPILKTTQVPILELWGDRDKPVSSRPTRETMRIPDRANIELVWIKGASHSLQIERPAEVAAHINRFVEQVESKKRQPPSVARDAKRMFDVPLLRVEEKSASFDALPRLRHESVTIFRAVEHEAGFNMHPYVAHHADRFWAMWSSNRIRDLKAGQHVRYATSDDGVKWSAARMIMPREDNANMRYFARGFWVRDGELIALAAYDEAVRPLFGPGLELRGYQWDEKLQRWDDPLVVADDTINNFPPKRLPSGEWMMSRRNHRMAKSMLVGGVESPSRWTVRQIAVPVDGARLDEPFWWKLPDGDLAAVFRDGSKSRRLYRSFSQDNGRTWAAPVRTNFPDATAKFNVLRLRDGRYAMASNPNPSGVRIPLCLSLSADGVLFDRMAVLRDAPTVYRYGGKDPGYAGYHYPQLLEHDRHLYVIHAENMEDIILLRIALADLAPRR